MQIGLNVHVHRYVGMVFLMWWGISPFAFHPVLWVISSFDWWNYFSCATSCFQVSLTFEVRVTVDFIYPHQMILSVAMAEQNDKSINKSSCTLLATTRCHASYWMTRDHTVYALNISIMSPLVVVVSFISNRIQQWNNTRKKKTLCRYP